MSRLFVSLQSEPQALHFPEESTDNIVKDILCNGRKFTDAGCGHFTGCYDWLRSAPNTVIGVRYIPFENTTFLLNEVTPGSRIELDSHGGLLIFFGDNVAFVESLSDDQDFEESRVLKSTDGGYALLFGCSGLAEGEENILLR